MHGAFVMAAMMSSAAGTWPGELSLSPPDLRTGGARPALEQVERLAAPAGSDPAAESGEAPDVRLERFRRWERALKWSTGGALVLTSTLGVIAAMNQPTAFGDGRCAEGDPVLGTYGCDRGLSTLHGMSGILAVTLYTANGALALAIPGPVGNVSARERGWHRALTYVHLGGIVLQPILGIVSAFPQVVGVRDQLPSDPFPRNLRTIHVGLGVVTTAAYLATIALER